MQNYEPIVKAFFEAFGYQVQKIAEIDEESPDFFISDGNSNYILELKTKFPSEKEVEERKIHLDAGAIHNINDLIIRKNRLSGIVMKAKKQLKKYEEKDIIRLVWLLATGHLSEPRILQFQATLYGSTHILDLSNKRLGICFFFYNSDFFRFRDVLDAAIISDESNAKLLLNPLSPRYMNTKCSSLIPHFGNAVVDPFELEREGKAFVVDSDVDRNDVEAVKKYLREKNKSMNIIEIPMNFLSGTMKYYEQ